MRYQFNYISQVLFLIVLLFITFCDFHYYLHLIHLLFHIVTKAFHIYAFIIFCLFDIDVFFKFWFVIFIMLILVFSNQMVFSYFYWSIVDLQCLLASGVQQTESVTHIYKSVGAQWPLTLWDPMDWGLPGSSVHGILQARILE